MKKLLFALMIISVNATGQINLPSWDSTRVVDIARYDDAVYSATIKAISFPRLAATAERDTVPVVFLVSTCVPCGTKTINGFVVRQKYSYQGDFMPTNSGLNLYSDEWREEKNLTAFKKEFEASVIIWQVKSK